MFKLNVTLATSFDVAIDIRKSLGKEEINVYFTKASFIKTTAIHLIQQGNVPVMHGNSKTEAANKLFEKPKENIIQC